MCVLPPLDQRRRVKCLAAQSPSHIAICPHARFAPGETQASAWHASDAPVNGPLRQQREPGTRSGVSGSLLECSLLLLAAKYEAASTVTQRLPPRHTHPHTHPPTSLHPLQHPSQLCCTLTALKSATRETSSCTASTCLPGADNAHRLHALRNGLHPPVRQLMERAHKRIFQAKVYKKRK